jgi:hypothetical protein
MPVTNVETLKLVTTRAETVIAQSVKVKTEKIGYKTEKLNSCLYPIFI